jgi:hypothetical protein
MLSKSIEIYKSPNFYENIFKMPRILKNKKASHSQKKPRGTMASSPLTSRQFTALLKL